MADNVVPFRRRCANDEAPDVPPFDPSDLLHLTAWQLGYRIICSGYRWAPIDEEQK